MKPEDVKKEQELKDEELEGATGGSMGNPKKDKILLQIDESLEFKDPNKSL
jgi:uncharacterized protein YpiB (UPF0302 family)